jgi:hypothetical protein
MGRDRRPPMANPASIITRRSALFDLCGAPWLFHDGVTASEKLISAKFRSRITPSTRAGIRHSGLSLENSPRPVLNVVVLSNARHGPIGPVGPVPGSRAARELQTRSACWRQLAAVQYIPVGILRLKRIRILSRPERALCACRADHANRHHRRNNGSPESNHSRSPKDFCSRAEHSR